MRTMEGMAQRGRWWSKTRGVPAGVYESWATSLAAQPGRQVRILAWANSVDGFCIGSPSALSSGDERGWIHVGWHQIEKGGWDSEARQLSWVLYGGGRGSIELTEQGRLPELFRERVAASIVLEKFVPIAGNRGVLITGRRDLSAADLPIVWNSTLGRGLSWQGEGVQAATEAAIAAVRSEYDRG